MSYFNGHDVSCQILSVRFYAIISQKNSFIEEVNQLREIGGYFGFEELIHKEHYPSLIALNTARAALLYVLKAKRIRKLYIPFYLCSSVKNMLERECYDYEFYHVGEDFMPCFNRGLKEGEYLYIVNYYGRINDAKILEFRKRYGNIIMDNVQAFFQAPVKDIDTLYCCRKFFGVPDGAYLYSNARLECEPETDISAGRMKHILGRCEGRSASDYYDDFRNAEKIQGSLPMLKMSWLTHNMLGAVDYEKVKRKREENYHTLNSFLGHSNMLPESFPEGPYAYPYYCKGGMEIKKKLAEKKIFVATLWPYSLTCGDSTAEDYSANILPLPCDQRYDSDDMKYIAEEVMRLVQTKGT